MSNVIDVVFAAPPPRARVFPYFAAPGMPRPTEVDHTPERPESTRGMSLFAALFIMQKEEKLGEEKDEG